MVAALVGDPARSNMLTALMNGRALTAGELAHQAGITPQTASSHLAKLEAGVLISTRRGFPLLDEGMCERAFAVCCAMKRVRSSPEQRLRRVL
jgi:DNA-binding transcriptional ArsR family regulator